LDVAVRSASPLHQIGHHDMHVRPQLGHAADEVLKLRDRAKIRVARAKIVSADVQQQDVRIVHARHVDGVEPAYQIAVELANDPTTVSLETRNEGGVSSCPGFHGASRKSASFLTSVSIARIS
jgi:hypothetical protein